MSKQTLQKNHQPKGVNGDTSGVQTENVSENITPMENNPVVETTPVADVVMTHNTPEVDVTPPVVEATTNTQAQAQAFADQNQSVLDLNALEAQMPTPTTKHLVASTRQYLSDMHPARSQNPKSCATGLGSLWRILNTTFNNLTDEEFNAFYPKFLVIVHANGDSAEKVGAFGLRYILRGIEDVNLNAEQLEALQRLINVVVNTADAATRKHAVQSLNWERALELGLNENARVRLLTFYGV